MTRLYPLVSLMFLGACSLVSEERSFIDSMPASSFEKEPEYDGPLRTIGELGEGYIHNTGALRRANNKLDALCLSAKVCEEQDEQ